MTKVRVPRTSEGKVELVNIATGQRVQRWPIDAREMVNARADDGSQVWRYLQATVTSPAAATAVVVNEKERQAFGDLSPEQLAALQPSTDQQVAEAAGPPAASPPLAPRVENEITVHDGGAAAPPSVIGSPTSPDVFLNNAATKEPTEANTGRASRTGQRS